MAGLWPPLSVHLAFREGLNAGLSVAVAARAAGVASDRVPVVERSSEGDAIAGLGFESAPCRAFVVA